MTRPRTHILVTGAAGFIGSFLVKALLQTNEYDIVGYDNLNAYYDVSLKQDRLAMLKEADTENCFAFVQADLCDNEKLSAVFAEFEPSIVVNLAAQAGVRYSIDHPREYVDSNLVGFFNVLEQCRHHQVEHLVYASSSSVYGDSASIPFSENDPCNAPVSLYAATKKSNELLAHAYAELYGIPGTGLRFFTVYGPMGRPDMAYFSFAKRMMANKPIQLFNQGDMLRDFTYVDDIVEGMVRIIGHAPAPTTGTPANIFNIGHGDPVQLRDFVEELETALRRHHLLEQPAVYEYLPMQPGDVHRTYADTTALQEIYGYSPQTPLATGMDAFASWLAANPRYAS